MNLEAAAPALLAALAIGLLIGVERGWQRREAEEGTRIAGVRTYGLLGLLGGVVGLLWQETGVAAFVVALLAVTVILVTAYALHTTEEGDSGITSAVAGLLTFVLGSLAGLGHPDIAAATAVAMVVLLGLKPELHNWLRRITREELQAAFTLLLLSVVLLPVLPDTAYGPWDAWNPRQIWMLVVLVAGLSFAGYIAVRLVGATRGLLVTGAFGGLASSTALTLNFARLARGRPELQAVLSAGLVLGCTTMFARMAVLLTVINPALLAKITPPLLAMAATGLLGAAILAWRVSATSHRETHLPNPIELKAAFGFGLLLALILLLTAALEAWFGDAGILVLAAISGLADVDAILVSLARLAAADTAADVAVTGMIIAAATNSLSKAALASGIGGRAMAVRVAPVLGAMAITGIAALILV